MALKIYCDGAELAKLEEYANDRKIEGFTTNPSLMRKAGISNYREFAKTVLAIVRGKPVSFEVVADDFETMELQAREIASWGENVWVKIPITNTQGESTRPVIEKLRDIHLNVTAVMTEKQLRHILPAVKATDIVSIFNGRITDTGAPPLSLPLKGAAQYLWASPRSVYDYYRARDYNYDIITMTPDLIAKLALQGKDLTEYSLETVRMFYEDGRGIGF